MDARLPLGLAGYLCVNLEAHPRLWRIVLTRIAGIPEVGAPKACPTALAENPAGGVGPRIDEASRCAGNSVVMGSGAVVGAQP